MRDRAEKYKRFTLVKLEQEERQLLAWEQERKQSPSQENLADAFGKIIGLHDKLWAKYPTAPMPREAKP